MTFTIEFSPWVKEVFASFGVAGGLILLGLILLVWGNRKVRRDNYNAATSWGTVVKFNWPAFLLIILGTIIRLATLVIGLIAAF